MSWPEAVVTFGSKPMGPPPMRPRPPARGDTAFAVGSRALITPSGSSSTSIQLLDEDGMPTQLSLPVDATVTITAWRPRRSAPPRYRVCSPEQVEGWIDAANLRRLPPPPPPVPMAVPAPVQPPVAKAVTKAAPKASPKTPAAAKPVAKVPAKPAPPSKGAAPSPARKAARPPAAARARQTPAKPPAKPKRSRPTSKRAR
jgi:hypothetical protein